MRESEREKERNKIWKERKKRCQIFSKWDNLREKFGCGWLLRNNLNKNHSRKIRAINFDYRKERIIFKISIKESLI
jgi:hypothetical protein